jgi:hypothetical protein
MGFISWNENIWLWDGQDAYIDNRKFLKVEMIVDIPNDRNGYNSERYLVTAVIPTQCHLLWQLCYPRQQASESANVKAQQDSP